MKSLKTAPIETFKEALQENDFSFEKSGSGYSTRCPVHGGSDTDSMTFTEGKNGKLLVTCHSKDCEYHEIMSAVGLEARDGFSQVGSKKKRNGKKRKVSKVISGSPTTTKKTKSEITWEGSSEYPYTDENGDLLFKVVKRNGVDEHGERVKKIYQGRPINGRFAWTIKSGYFEPKGGHYKKVAEADEPRPSSSAVLMRDRVRLVPYQIPELIEAREDAETIYVVEGEKDVETLRKLGYYATTNPVGAGKNIEVLSEHLKGAKKIIVVGDNDDPGRDHVEKVAQALSGLVEELVVVELPGLPPGGDVTDYFDSGGDTSDFWSICDAAPEWVPSSHSVDDPRQAAIDLIDALDEGSSMVEIEDCLRRVVGIVADEDDLCREGIKRHAAQHLKSIGVPSPSGFVKTAMNRQTSRNNLSEKCRLDQAEGIEPWPDEVLGDDLLRLMYKKISQYIVVNKFGKRAVALWGVFTHVYEAFSIAPILLISSPTKQCGKSSLLEILGGLVPRPELTSNITPAALFRTIEAHKPTLLIDEADSFYKRGNDLKNVLNAGHQSSGYVTRCAGPDFEPRRFRVFGPKAIGLIGNLPDTLEDRSIIIPMERKAPTDKVDRLRISSILSDTEDLRRMCARWAEDNRESLLGADPDVPDILSDRAQDNWRPLLAIADLAGGKWPVRAREAAQRLSRSSEDQSEGTQLLSDIAEFLQTYNKDEMRSDTLVKYLVSLEGRPWQEMGHQRKPLTPARLAKILKPFGVKPTAINFGGNTFQGYRRKELEDVCSRYAL